MSGVFGGILLGRAGLQASSVSTPSEASASRAVEYRDDERREEPLTHSPSPNLPKPEEYINPPAPDPTKSGPPPQLPAGYGRWREYRYDPNAVVVPAPAWAEGGSLQGWRSGGFLSNHARREGGGGDEGGGRRGGWVKDLSTVLCFRCNQYGHFANQCPNDAVPGDRGGLQGQRGEGGGRGGRGYRD